MYRNKRDAQKILKDWEEWRKEVESSCGYSPEKRVLKKVEWKGLLETGVERPLTMSLKADSILMRDKGGNIFLPKVIVAKEIKVVK